MSAHITVNPAFESLSAAVKSLPLGNCHLEIEIADTRITIFGDERHAAGLGQIAALLKQTFAPRPVSEMPPREPANPDDISF
ncbi:MAG: hypothetical protein KYX69_19825 [Sphingomonas sp.]|uniref:hypothetical protein n=1 Tax=Sphingomonas sp. TaxID=28214 RepID=UPI00262C01A0|nr:hypothetical protein [Sphingomonas sp.]MDK2769954.1 hypothetical protein [Sphingomonas sp.]